MAFFNKIFGTTVTADMSAAEPGDIDVITSLSMHLRGETAPALSAYMKIGEEDFDYNIARFFAAAIKAGNGNISESAESLQELSRRISLGGETISRVISEELVAMINNGPYIKAPAVAETVVSFGDHLKKEGFVQESAVCFEIGAGLVPNHANVLHKLGDTLHDLRLYDYAEAVLLEALKYAPYHWGALYTYAVLLQDLGRIDEAITYYERAVELNPDHAKCHNNYGAALMAANRLEEAITHCTLAAESDRNFPLAKINLGNIYLLLNSYEAARTCFTEAISLDTYLPIGYFGLGTAEDALGSDPRRIQELYRKAIELSPSFADAHHALGNLLARDNDPESLSHFSAAVELNDKLVNLHRDFANACLKLGRREEALEHIKIALQQNPDDVLARDILVRVEKEKCA